jgi:Tol biopolymer transport system component
MRENPSAHDRLDSWKEIADYLKRDVRTVIRWGKARGLPVHRVPGGKRQAVFAYPEEIDAWLGSQGGNGSSHSPLGLLGPESNGHNGHNNNVAGDAEAVAPAARPASIARNILLSRRILLIAVAGLFGLAGMGAMFMRFHTRAAIRPLSFKQLTDDGRSKGGLRTDGTTLYFNEAEGARSILVSAPVSGSPSSPIDTPFSNVALQDLSNDGKTLLIISSEGIVSEGPLWTIPAQGGTPRRVGDAVCNQARWSPDNRRIVCAGRTTITVMDADGSNARTLAAFSSPVDRVSWTPDGARLRFTLEDTSARTTTTWEIDANQAQTAAQPQRLPLGPSCCTDWTWIQGGKTFMYAEPDASGKDCLMMTPESSVASGGHETELQVKIGAIASVAPARTSNALYLITGNSYRGELMKFNAQQGSLQSFLPGLSAEYLSFSKDGQWMTYADSGGGSLWRSRADGSEPLQLTKPPMHVEVSSWSPDGRRIAFTGNQPGKPFRIYLVDRDGGPIQEAAEGNDNQGGPSWSPDGKAIVYGNVFCEKTQDCWVRRLDLATRKTEIVPGSNGHRTARWSPDGRYIAALQFQTLELMLFDTSRQRWKTLAGSIGGDNINWSSDSQYVYVDSPRDKKPIVERVRIKDGQRVTVVSLSLHQVSGQISGWIGLTPDNSPILYRLLTAGEVYELKWTDQ